MILEQSENTRLEDISLAILNGIVGQVNETIAAKLNDLINAAGVARSYTTGELLGRVPTLVSIATDAKIVIAEFNVAITK